MTTGTYDNEILSTEDAQPTFLMAIAQQLADVNGGTIQQHVADARQLLGRASRDLERNEPTAGRLCATYAA